MLHGNYKNSHLKPRFNSQKRLMQPLAIMALSVALSVACAAPPPQIVQPKEIESREDMELLVPVVSELLSMSCDPLRTRGAAQGAVSRCFSAQKSVGPDYIDSLMEQQLTLIDNATSVAREKAMSFAGGWLEWNDGCSRIALAAIPESERGEPNFDDAPELNSLDELQNWVAERQGPPDIIIERDPEYWCSEFDQVQANITPRIKITRPSGTKFIGDCNRLFDEEIVSPTNEASVSSVCVRTTEEVTPILQNLVEQLEQQGFSPSTDDYYGYLRLRDECTRITVAPFPPMNDAPWRTAHLVVEALDDYFCTEK